ncbi:hypothetical protein [Campylobacter showae]|uniref:hypothetical protein n=1 Tax=Campylobacter showae TaxID=204 RepID=UPI000F086DF6|nr:hypothetical protein [Campylobacter showae]
MNPFKILIFAVVVNLAFAGDASKDINLTADAARNQKEVKMLETLCGSIFPFSMASCMQLADKRLDENNAFYDRQNGLAALQKVCVSKDERDSKLACTKLACESGESRECLNVAKYYQVLLVGGVAASAFFQKSCDERGGMDCLYAKFFDKARDRMTDEYVQKMKKYLKKACDAGEKEGCKEFEKLREL